MKKIRIEAVKHDPERPNDWRVKISIDDEPPIQEVKSTFLLPQYIYAELMNVLSKRASS
jgi:hypothetical protein